ncbi:MAG: hypothetical protein WBI20_00265 [Burkholderiaceae bacterium]
MNKEPGCGLGYAQVLVEAGGLGVRSPAQARGRLLVRAIVAALTPAQAHELWSNRESGLRPDTRTIGLSGNVGSSK